MIVVIALLMFSCSSTSNKDTKMTVSQEIKKKSDEFVSFKLTTDLNVLTEKEKMMLPLLLEAAKLMEEIYWVEAFGNKDELCEKDWDEYTRKFIQLKSSCGKSLNIEKLKERCLNNDNTLIICNDINLYPNDEKYQTKKILADKFVYNKIINYVEVIKNAKEIYLIDSCFIGIVLPLFKTNQLKVEKDKIQIILRDSAINNVIY